MTTRFLLLGFLLAAAGCAEEPEVQNLILITVDTLRADHLSCYGYENIETGNIDRLAKEGILYRKALSAAPWTCPSMASIFTSLYPEAHGMVLHPIRDAKVFNALSPKLTTLPEAFRKAGYETHALSEQDWFSETFGFGQGFDTFQMLDGQERAITDEAMKIIDNATGDRPFFLYVHYLDPHTPYTPPPRFTLPHPGKGNYGYEGLDWEQWWKKLWSLKPETEGVKEELSFVQSLYDGEVLFVDHEIGRLLKCLHDAGLEGSTAVALISDHGEGFLEHAMLHGSTLHIEELHVPMIIKIPWRSDLEGEDVEEPSSLLDLMPTLLHLLDLPIPKSVQGKAVLPGGEPQAFLFSENAYDLNLKKVQSQRYSMIMNKMTRQNLFYDLEADPMEEHDAALKHPEAFREHLTILNQWIEKQKRWVKPESPTIDLSEEMEERLRGLGYLK